MRQQYWICVDAKSLRDIKHALRLGNIHGHYDHMITDIVSKADWDALLDELKQMKEKEAA